MCPTKNLKNRKVCPTDVSDKNEQKCEICLTWRNYNFQAFGMAFKPTYSNYTSILFNTQYNTLGSCATYVSNYMLLDKSNVHACAWYMRMGIIWVFQENANKTQNIFVEHILRFFFICVGQI